MFRFFEHRLGHYCLLIAVSLLMTLPNLGAATLFDYDEGVNAEAAREMLEADNWLVPMFNFELRTAKPIMLYWLQMTSYRLFGVNEFAARFPSLLAGLFTVLFVYELGRRMFRPSTGLLAGLALSSAIYFCMMSRASTPDATLLCFTVLTFLCFWEGFRDGRRSWFIPTAISCGLATLTKGPVGLALPGLAIFTYLIWNRQLSRVWDRRLVWGILAFCLVALPWYILVSVETRGAWPAGFFGKDNFQRFSTPLENHRGPIFYHLLGLFLFFAPWSVFLCVTLWNGWQESRRDESSAIPTHEPTRFLLCWFGTYLVFFSIAATKLPNYVLPCYPALALLTARFLDSWRTGERTYPRWMMPAAWSGLVFVGVVVSVGLLVAGGAIPLSGVKMRIFPGLERWAMVGLLPLVAVGVGIWYHRQGLRSGAVACVVLASLSLIGTLAAGATSELNAYKAPASLVRDSEMRQPGEEIKIGAFLYFQPSLVFYAERQIQKIDGFEQAHDFLSLPYHCYLMVPEPVWNEMKHRVTIPLRQAARRYDFLKNQQILVLTNR
jgi:4-amino-4-deoxy-L-arabinose transferase-like glycosyltransferase